MFVIKHKNSQPKNPLYVVGQHRPAMLLYGPLEFARWFGCHQAAHHFIGSIKTDRNMTVIVPYDYELIEEILNQ